jgi:hypothetical protein
MVTSEAKKYHGYARECLRLAEEADKPETRQRLVELSRTWMEAALTEEKKSGAPAFQRSKALL